MASKQKAQGGKGKRKNNGTAEARYKDSMRWISNKKRTIKRGEREAAKHASKHARRRTLGYRARQIARNAGVL